MSPTTPALVLPYPSLTDTPDVPYWTQQLADRLEALMGAAFAAFTPSITGTGWSLGNGTLDGKYRQVGKLVTFRAVLTFGSTTTAGSGQLAFALPAASRNDGQYTMHRGVARDVSASAYAAVDGLITPGSSQLAMFADINAGSAVRTAVPFTWATGDQVHVSGTYERV